MVSLLLRAKILSQVLARFTCGWILQLTTTSIFTAIFQSEPWLDQCHTYNFVVQLYRATKLQCATAHVAHCDKSHKRTKQMWLLVTLMMILLQSVYSIKLEMWANAQRDGRPAEHSWRPLFNAAKFG